MVRFLHTADWQIGMKASHTGEKAKVVRQKRFDAAGRIVELAKQKDVDFVLLAGDTFEDHNVGDVAVKRTVDILNRLDPIPVYVLPGNHDPMVPGGIWDLDSWQRVGSHVALLREQRDYYHGDDVALYACPLTQKQSGLDPTAWIPGREDGDDRIRIGVAHGSLNILPDHVNFPIAADRPEQSGLDYLALGDWHGHRISGRAVYPGTMEPTRFGEKDSGNVLVVDIDEAGAEPRIEACRVNSLTWTVFDPTIQTVDDVEMLDRTIRDLGSLDSFLLKISPDLSGCTDSKALQRLETLREELRESAFFLEWVDPAYQPVISEGVDRIPDGILYEVDEALATILDGRIPEGPGHQFADQDPEVVQAARMLLHRLAGGAIGMIVEEIMIRNWRSYREPHTFRFGEGFNLLVGRNEAGKSTLFEAFTRVLFDRHTSRTEEIRQIQPLGSSLAPEATIVFRMNGDRYRVRKRFLQNPTAEFFTWRGNDWDRDHEGDAADKAVRDILRGEVSPRTSAKPEHRGLCQALWYLQGDTPLPKEAWADGVKEGLSGFVSLVARSPDEDRVLQKIEDEFKEFYTPKGKIKSGSRLDQFQKKIPELEGELQALYERDRGVKALRLELEGFAEQLRSIDEELSARRAEVAGLKQKLSEGAALEEEKKQKEEIVRQAEATRKKTADDRAAVERRIKQIEEINKSLAEKQREYEESLAEGHMEQIAAERYHEVWKKVHEPELQQVDKELAILHAIERTRQLEDKMERIQEQIDRIQTTETELRELENELSTTPLPTKKDLKAYQERKLKLATLRGQIEQAAIRIRFDLQTRNPSITADPDAEFLTEDGEYLVLGPTTFAIGDLGTIHVRGGGSSLEELQTKTQSLSAEVVSLFERFGVMEEQDLYSLQQRRQDLEREIKRHKTTLKELTSEKDLDQLKEDVARTQQKITDETSKTGAAPPDWQDLSGDAVRELSENLSTRKKELTKAIEHEQQNEAEARTAHDDASRKTQEASSRLVELKTEIRGLVRANDETLRSYSTYENLQAALAKETEALKQAEEDFARLLTEYRIRVEEPKAQYEEAQETLKGLKEQMQSVEREIVDRNARIEEAVSKDFYSSTGDLEALLDLKRRRLNQVTRQAEAVKLLRDMVQAFKKEQSTALSGPVAELINRWLLTLTSGSYDSVQIDENLFPVGIFNPQYDEALPLKCLSYGTHEQVIVLLRLAIGVHLSNSERNLVVIDDRLVNADPIRMRRLCQILEEVATNHCQVVVATCNDTPYAGVREKKTIPVPGDGRAD